MRKIIFTVTFLLLTTTVQAESWVYADPFMLKRDQAVVHRDTVEIQTSPRASVIIGDVGDEATFCPQDNKYICVTSKSFEFAVPKNILSDNKQWVVNKTKYQITGEDTVHILGEEYKILYIENSTSKIKYRYFYSTPHGLIGFSVAGKGQSRLYLLEGKNGFGAEDKSQK